jgi:hypothetical protein
MATVIGTLAGKYIFGSRPFSQRKAKLLVSNSASSPITNTIGTISVLLIVLKPEFKADPRSIVS